MRQRSGARNPGAGRPAKRISLQHSTSHPRRPLPRPQHHGALPSHLRAPRLRAGGGGAARGAHGHSPSQPRPRPGASGTAKLSAELGVPPPAAAALRAPAPGILFPSRHGRERAVPVTWARPRLRALPSASVWKKTSALVTARVYQCRYLCS